VKTIHKYMLDLEGKNLIPMPKGAQILTVQLQRELCCLWAIVDSEQPEILRRIDTYSAECEFVGGKYINTIQLRNGFPTIHVFDLGEEGESLKPILSEWDLSPEAQESYQRFCRHIQEKRNEKKGNK